MDLKNISLYIIILITFLNCKTLENSKYQSLEDGLYAEFQTTQGEFLVKFNFKESPVTVANFIGLAEGKIPNTAKEKNVPFYDGVIFHRIIKDFMIQGGDPKGTGEGDPGYKFDDEKNDLKHYKKGILSMANSGPNTNGSQFFITEVATPWLDGKHTIFGEVVQGVETIDKLANVKTGAQDKPIENQIINKVIIIKKGKEYKHFEAEKFFNENKNKIQENNKIYLASKLKETSEKVAKIKEGMTTTASGLMYKIVKQTEGKQPKKGDSIAAHYAGIFEDGRVFDSSYVRNEPLEFPVGIGRVIKGWDEGLLLMKEGEKAILWIPSELAYGTRGAGGVIPPNTNLIFEVELVKVK